MDSITEKKYAFIDSVVTFFVRAKSVPMFVDVIADIVFIVKIFTMGLLFVM
jgi:hypothetical protein